MKFHNLIVKDEIASAVIAASELTMRLPTLAMVHAAQFDTQLKNLGWNEPITYALNGYFNSEINSDIHITEDLKKYPWKYSNLFNAHSEALNSPSQDIIALLFEKVRGPEIPSLNLCYANKAIEIDTLWTHFFNKYLQHNGQKEKITLNHGSSSKFDRLNSETRSNSDLFINGPLVTVIMPFFNAENTLNKAASSILKQSWKNLELILVDDCSEDKSFEIARRLKEQDHRVKIISLNVNGGPYVAKNIALASARGDYITVHDADDWAFPSRITEQMQPLLNVSTTGISVTMGRTLRFKKNGQFTRFNKTNINCLDGANRLCYPSPLFERNYFDQKLGAWDSVRMGADSEIFNRVLRFEPSRIQILNKFVMLQLDIEDSITRQDDTHNDERGESPLRLDYRKSWTSWHESLSTIPRIDFPQSNRPFVVPRNIQSNQSIADELNLINEIFS